jgi:hypothetical protein
VGQSVGRLAARCKALTILPRIELGAELSSVRLQGCRAACMRCKEGSYWRSDSDLWAADQCEKNRLRLASYAELGITVLMPSAELCRVPRVNGSGAGIESRVFSA